MELPKHTTQVGTIAANKKLYLEDYCISYMKQLCETCPEERKQIALYGTVERDKTIEYAFIYGAALLGKGRGRTDSLTANQKEEAEQIRAEFFEDYQLAGVVISTDSVSEDVYWLGSGNKSIPMDGYYIFYDTNEPMLNFMMQNQEEEREIDLDPVIAKKADMDREKQKRAEAERAEAMERKGTYRKKLQGEAKAAKPGQGKRTSRFPVAACILLLAICGVYGAKAYYPEFGLKQVTGYVSELFDGKSILTGSFLGEKEEASSGDRLVKVESVGAEEAVQNGASVGAAGDQAGQQDAAVGTQDGLPDSESAGEGIVITNTEVEKPAELDVIVIPSLEELTGENIGSGNAGAEDQAGSIGQDGNSDADHTNPLTGNQTETTVPAGSSAITVENADKDAADAESKKPEKYLIKKGDNLLRILRSHYGDESRLKEICDVNGIANPDNIQVGQTIVLP